MEKYMSVEELKSEYLEVLKMRVYYTRFEDLEKEFGKEMITKEIIENLENCIYWYEISDETIYKLFSGISFVKEDFEV